MDPDWHTAFQLNGARYILLPFLLITSVILALLDAPRVRLRGREPIWPRRIGLLWLVALLAVNYSVTSDRSRGPRWDRELAHARRVCDAPRKSAASVLVSPSPPRVWFAMIPCRRL
jgi:hypothetical protein